MSWKISGSYFGNLLMQSGLLARARRRWQLGATRDRCRVTLVFNIHSGDVEGTDVGGLTVAAIADTPKVMSDGNWRLGVFIDAAASDQQAERLGGVFSGALGGPMAGRGRPGVWRTLASSARRSRCARRGCATRCGSVTRWTSRWRTWCPSGWTPASRRGSSASSTRRHRSSPWLERHGRRSTLSASSTRASPASPRRSSRGQPRARSGPPPQPRDATPRVSLKSSRRSGRAWDLVARCSLALGRARLVGHRSADGRDGCGSRHRPRRGSAGSPPSGW